VALQSYLMFVEKGKLKDFILLYLKSPKNLSGKIKKLILKNHKGRSKDNFLTFGSNFTGRFTSFGINFLNLPRSPIDLTEFNKRKKLIKNPSSFFKEYKEDSYSKMKEMTRPLLMAKKNHLFYGGDFSQIEFRLLMLLCDETKTLAKIFKGFDPYVHLAKKIYKKEEISKDERYISKRATLAFGYGMGVDKLSSILEGEGFKSDIKDLENLKDAYHREFTKVKKFWRKLEHFKNSKIIIPYSGRVIEFTEVKKDRLGTFIKNSRGFENVWGGHLTGIVTQGLARDVFCYKIRELFKKLKMQVLLPYHDEVLCEVDPKKIKFSDFLKTIQKTPSFLPKNHFPKLEGDFWKSKRYVK